MQERENPTEEQLEDMIENDQIEAAREDQMIEQQIEDDMIEDQIHAQPDRKVDPALAEKLKAAEKMEKELADDPFSGMKFEATATNSPPPDQVAADVADMITDQGQRQADKALNEKLTEAEKRFNERLGQKKDDPQPQAQKQQAANDHGLGPQAEQQRAMADQQRIQAFIDDVFKVVAHHKPSNLHAIAVLELVKDEYIRMSKTPQHVVAPQGGQGPAGIVKPGGPVPPPPGGPRR